MGSEMCIRDRSTIGIFIIGTQVDIGTLFFAAGEKIAPIIPFAAIRVGDGDCIFVIADTFFGVDKIDFSAAASVLDRIPRHGKISIIAFPPVEKIVAFATE